MSEVLTLERAASMLKDAMRDRSWMELPLGREVAAYMRQKKKRLTAGSEDAYGRALARMVLYFPTLSLEDLELPQGASLIEQFMDDTWGTSAPRTYNVNLVFIRDFFRFQVGRGRMKGNPCDPIKPYKERERERTTFSEDEVHRIIQAAEKPRDRIALRLMLDLALRRGAIRAVQFKHFDHARRRLTVFTKGGVVRPMPIPVPAFWHDLERIVQPMGPYEPDHFLLPKVTRNQYRTTEDPTHQASVTAVHRWWYERLQDAGIVAKGTYSGARPHKARHTAGQRMLDATGNIVAVKELLMHRSISTTVESYVGWDEDRLIQSMKYLEGE